MPFINQLKEINEFLRGNKRCQNVGISHHGTEVVYFKKINILKIVLEAMRSGTRAISKSFKGKNL